MPHLVVNMMNTGAYHHLKKERGILQPIIEVAMVLHLIPFTVVMAGPLPRLLPFPMIGMTDEVVIAMEITRPLRPHLELGLHLVYEMTTKGCLQGKSLAV